MMNAPKGSEYWYYDAHTDQYLIKEDAPKWAHLEFEIMAPLLNGIGDREFIQSNVIEDI